jgi:hypothetical protein
MTNGKRSSGSGPFLSGAFAAALLCAVSAAAAQDSGGNTVIGPPQLKDFSLQPRDRTVTRPAPEPAQPQPADISPPNQPPARAEVRSREAPPAAARARRDAEAEARATAPARSAGQGVESPPPAIPVSPAASAEAAPPRPLPGLADTPLPKNEPGTPLWYFALPVAALAFVGLAMVRRRRRNGAATSAVAAAPAAVPPPKPPRPDPIPRPWLELSLKAERAAFTTTESEVLFELEIANKGGSPARNLRIDVKMFNAGAEQDQQIGAFFKTAGRESTKLNLPEVEAGVTGVIKGTVTLPIDEMKAMRLDERLLFIPVVAVNALYDWGEGRTGQTSRSYIIGRELPEAGEKMGPFRVDQGPRVWRTVGQREHALAKRI